MGAVWREDPPRTLTGTQKVPPAEVVLFRAPLVARRRTVGEPLGLPLRCVRDEEEELKAWD